MGKKRKRRPPYFARGRKVYHTKLKCSLGNNIEGKNRQWGKPGGGRMCKLCKRRH